MSTMSDAEEDGEAAADVEGDGYMTSVHLGTMPAMNGDEDNSIVAAGVLSSALSISAMSEPRTTATRLPVCRRRR
jgi:hypothetical protein